MEILGFIIGTILGATLGLITDFIKSKVTMKRAVKSDLLTTLRFMKSEVEKWKIEEREERINLLKYFYDLRRLLIQAHALGFYRNIKIQKIDLLSIEYSVLSLEEYDKIEALLKELDNLIKDIH